MKNAVLLALLTTVAVLPTLADHKHKKPFQFIPVDSSANSIEWDARAPWKLPEGFEQTVVA